MQETTSPVQCSPIDHSRAVDPGCADCGPTLGNVFFFKIGSQILTDTTMIQSLKSETNNLLSKTKATSTQVTFISCIVAHKYITKQQGLMSTLQAVSV